MATLRFLDSPKAQGQIERERGRQPDPSSARVEQVVRVVLCGLSIAGVAFGALIVTAGVSMMTSKQAWLSSLRAPYDVESVTLVAGPGRTDDVACWTGSTVNLIARIKHQGGETRASSSVAITLSGELDGASRPWTVEQAVEMPASAMAREGDTVTVPFTIDVPAWMAHGALRWTVQATGSGDESADRGSRTITIMPCGQAT